MTEAKSWAERFAANQADPEVAQWIAPKAQAFTQNFEEYADMIPDLDVRESDGIDEVLDQVGILDAYNRWCGKMQPDGGGKREGIMVSCPNPAHPDSHPSAWLNLDQDVWFCGSCNQGGDKFDIAAWFFGMPVPGYKDKTEFPKLRVKMAESMGHQVVQSITGRMVVAPQVPTPVAPSVAEPVQDEATGVAPPGNEFNVKQNVTREGKKVITGPFGTISIGANYDDDKVAIDWKSLVPPNTFLYEWMEQTTRTDEPNEYLFWLGLSALACAAGNNVLLSDDPPVRANLYLCLVGSSGSRKSRSVHRMKALLDQALPFDYDDVSTTGTMAVATPGSAETLVDLFARPIMDDNVPGLIIGYQSVRGLITFGELTDLVGRATRQGSVLKPTLMEFFDSRNRVAISSRAHGEVRAENHFCQVITTTQPKALREVVDRVDVDSGFLNRWVFVKGIEKPRRPLGGVDTDITEAIELLRKVRAWCSPRQIKLVLEPEARFGEIFFGTIVPALDQENSILERLDLMFKKLIMLFAINERQALPSVELVERAAQLLPYLIHTYEATDKNIGYGPFEDCCDAVKSAIKNFDETVGRPPNMREIRTLVPKRFNADLLQRVVKALTTVGVVEEVIEANAKVPRFRVVA